MMKTVKGKSAYHFALGADFDESSTISLRDGGELAACVTCPAPGGGAFSSRAAQVGMALEVVEINLMFQV